MSNDRRPYILQLSDGIKLAHRSVNQYSKTLKLSIWSLVFFSIASYLFLVFDFTFIGFMVLLIALCSFAGLHHYEKVLKAAHKELDDIYSKFLKVRVQDKESGLRIFLLVLEDLKPNVYPISESCRVKAVIDQHSDEFSVLVEAGLTEARVKIAALPHQVSIHDKTREYPLLESDASVRSLQGGNLIVAETVIF